MKNNKKIVYGLLSLFSLILAAHWFFFYSIASVTGGQIVIGANNMASAGNYSNVAREQAVEVMVKFQEYFAQFYPLQFDWTIGNYHLVPVYLSIVFLILATVFFVLFFMQKENPKNEIS